MLSSAKKIYVQKFQLIINQKCLAEICFENGLCRQSMCVAIKSSDQCYGLCAWNRLQSLVARIDSLSLSYKHMSVPSEFAKVKAIVTALLQSM